MGGVTKVIGYFPSEARWVEELDLELWKRAEKGEVEKTFEVLKIAERIRQEDTDFELDRISVHGVRNGTTCDLLAAGVSEARIKLHCR